MNPLQTVKKNQSNQCLLDACFRVPFSCIKIRPERVHVHKSSLDSRFFTLCRPKSPAILNGFTDLLSARHGGAGQVGDGPRHLQDPVVSTRRPAEALASLAQQSFTS